MKLDRVTKIKQTSSENEVNEFLAKGYIILKILSGRASNQFGVEEVKPIYVLGLQKEEIGF